ncbi:MAG: TIGR00730 family Rossman fold protein [Candidatus Wildermuthbacteria bacterium]|nr:TIGR00730 family Rossman fold protein [Candidatus Wildermuthbacteria bacterium]
MTHEREKMSRSRIAEVIENHAIKTADRRVELIKEEFERGFEFLKRFKKTVSVFGSARTTFDHQLYQDATSLASRLTSDGYTIITGGGPGIMEAANRGAFEAGGRSVGLNIELPSGQQQNQYVTESVVFHHFFVRKVMLAFAADAYVFFPGGFGTLDEFFELVMLIETQKTAPVPVILVGTEYWSPLLSWIENILLKQHRAIDEKDTRIYTLTSDANEAYRALSGTVSL